jgi:hypothetical protein
MPHSYPSARHCDAELKSINVRELHEAGLIAIALSVLCQPRGINSGNCIIHRLVHAGLALFLRSARHFTRDDFACARAQSKRYSFLGRERERAINQAID